MADLNYHHLRYLWAVVREGGVSAASRALHVSQPTISAQLRALERNLGESLFHRGGRKLVLTDTGRVVFRYAQEIFALGAELEAYVAGREPSGVHARLRVGIADVVPKLVAHHILEPALALEGGEVDLTCFEGKPATLFAQLATYELDAVISDVPLGPQHNVRAFNHLLGESGLTWFAHPEDAPALRKGFPGSLADAACLLPTVNTAVRRDLDRWFTSLDIRPRTVAEFEDSALLKVFGADGIGAFAAPTVIEDDILAQYGVEAIGRISDVRERFYVVSVERRVQNAAVAAIVEAARERLFD